MHLLTNFAKKWGVSAIVSIIGTMLIFAALFCFQQAAAHSVETSIHNTLVEINQTAAMTLRNGLKSCEDLLKLQAKMLGGAYTPTDDDDDDDDVLYLLRDFSKDRRFERLSFVRFDGTVYSSAFGMHTLDNMDALPNIKSDETTIGQPRKDTDDALKIDISTPVYRNGQKIGRLIATLDEKLLQNMYNVSGLEGDAALAMFSGAEGQVIATFSNRVLPIRQGDCVYDFLERPDVKMHKGSAQTYRADVQAKNTGWMEYEFNNKTICRYYAPLGINDWYIAVTATDHSIRQRADDIRYLGALLAVWIILVLLAVATIVSMQHAREQARVTALKNTYNIAIRKTNDIFYEVDVDSDQLVDHSESTEKAVWSEAPKSYSKALSQIADACAPEYRQQLLETLLAQSIKTQMKAGVSPINFEYKITPDANTVRWISATVVPVTGEMGGSTKLICMENDITEQKLNQERLNLSATVDGLSALYNRSTTEAYINSFLQAEGNAGQHALLLIDIDAFKSVNDTLGHVKGDAVITECGELLRRVFRRNDIVGRIGGDEFAVLLKDYGTPQLIIAKAKDVCNAFRQTQYLEDEPTKTVNISASIGIALYGSDGKTFHELYTNADSALYAAKHAGKDRFAFFTNTESL